LLPHLHGREFYPKKEHDVGRTHQRSQRKYQRITGKPREGIEQPSRQKAAQDAEYRRNALAHREVAAAYFAGHKFRRQREERHIHKRHGNGGNQEEQRDHPNAQGDEIHRHKKRHQPKRQPHHALDEPESDEHPLAFLRAFQQYRRQQLKGCGNGPDGKNQAEGEIGGAEGFKVAGHAAGNVKADGAERYAQDYQLKRCYMFLG
jgi:hypothetical protein